MNLQFTIYNFQKTVLAIALLLFSLIFVPLTLAHVTVKPNQVGIGTYQTFTVSVPNEKDNPTVAVRLVIPDGLESVTPTVKPGWQIKIERAGDMKGMVLNNGRQLTDEEAQKVVQIEWTQGSVPAGQRDEFTFSAKTPSSPTELQWKAYQTYQNGVIVAWDQDPKAPKPSASGETEGSTPFSVTKVVNDLTATPGPVMVQGDQSGQPNTPLYFSIAAVLLSCAAIGLALRKR